MIKRVGGVCALVCILTVAQEVKAQTVTWDKDQPPGKQTNKITGTGTYTGAPGGAVSADIQVAVKDAAGKVTTYKFGTGVGNVTNPNGGKGTWKFDTSNIAKLAAGTYGVSAYIRFYNACKVAIGKDIPVMPPAMGIVVLPMAGCMCPPCPPPGPNCPPPCPCDPPPPSMDSDEE